MKHTSISLPMILSGLDYIINYIKIEKENHNNLACYGIFPGAKVRLLFCSPYNDPKAYEIMGAVIALRDDDSKNIFVSPAE